MFMWGWLGNHFKFTKVFSMQSEEKIIELLTEIRDIQAKHFAEYCKISAESIAMQRDGHAAQKLAIDHSGRAIETQRKAFGLQKYLIVALVPCIAFLIWEIFKR
jgi:hypothetical protein